MPLTFGASKSRTTYEQDLLLFRKRNALRDNWWENLAIKSGLSAQARWQGI
jgi:hypothetical protein